MTEFFEFRTTTPRTVGLRLCPLKGELKCWLNGNYQPQRTKKIVKNNKWYPCIKIKDKGNQIILNPFAIDPENQFNIYDNGSHLEEKYIEFGKNEMDVDVIKKFLNRWVVFTGNNSK